MWVHTLKCINEQMAGIDKDIFIKYVFAKLAEAPALARSYTGTDGNKLKYRTVYIKLEISRQTS